jgi:hypothetical protein
LIQAQVLTGKIADRQKLPIPFANIILLNADSLFLTGSVSNTDGVFQLIFSDDAVWMKISCIGYQEKIISLPANQVDMGDILLEEDTYMLGEVIIKEDLPKTYISGDAIVTHVAGSVLEKAGSAQEVLASLPGVIHKGEDLNVFGRGVPVIYINNREVHDLTELNQLTSDNIKLVEVISNPGSRYANSVKAVIRIQTKKKENEGFGFSERANLNYNNDVSFGNQFNINYRQNKIDISGMFSYANQSDWRNYAAVLKTYLDDDTWEQTMIAKQMAVFKRLIGNMTFNYTFDSNHSLGISYRHSYLPKSVMNMDLKTNIFQNPPSPPIDPIETSTSDINSKNKTTGHEGNIYYNGNIGKWNINFNGTILWNNDLTWFLTQDSIGPTNEILDTIHTNTHTHNTFSAGKLVLSYPLFGGDLSFGGEYTHTLRTGTYTYEGDGIIPDDTSKIKEDMTAAFAEYGYELGKIKLQVGLRFENINFDYYKPEVFLFPSLMVIVPIGKIQTQLNYTSDITRPSYQMLRNRIDYINRYTYESGNPLLRPSVTQNFSITGIYKWWQLYADLQHRKNDIIFSSEPYSEENTTIALLHQVNIPSYNLINVMLEAAPTIGRWSPQFILELYKQWYTTIKPGTTDELALNKPAYAARWRNNIELPCGLTLRADFNWEGISEQKNMAYESVWWANASLYKDFLNGHLTFLLQANDVFNTYRSDYTVYYGALRMMSMDQKFSRRFIGLTVHYKFNVLKNKYKGTGAGTTQKERL